MFAQEKPSVLRENVASFSTDLASLSTDFAKFSTDFTVFSTDVSVFSTELAYFSIVSLPIRNSDRRSSVSEDGLERQSLSFQ